VAEAKRLLTVIGTTAVASKKKRGRDREDKIAARVAELKDAGKSWAKLTTQINRETGEKATMDRYRSLYRSRRGKRTTPLVKIPASTMVFIPLNYLYPPNKTDTCKRPVSCPPQLQSLKL